MAFTLEEIWRTRNVVLHHKGEVDLQSSIQIIHSKVHECYLIFSKTELTNLDPSTPKWSSPTLGTIKINVDAAISSSNAALVVVARNSQGSVLNIWARITPKRSPLQAEAEAMAWAVQLAT